MFNGTSITIRGNVATEPTLRVTGNGTALCSFRIAVTARRYSTADRRTVDVDTSFYTVTAWRLLAENAVVSLTKGDGVVVTGRLRVRDFVHDGLDRTSADIVADAIGHDLTWGTTRLTKVLRAEATDPDQAEADALADEVTVGAGPDGDGHSDNGHGDDSDADPATAGSSWEVREPVGIAG